MSIKLSTGLKNKWLGAAADDGSLQELLDGGLMKIYTGAQPSDADQAESGILLLEITLSGGTFVPDTGAGSTNGLTWDNAVAGVLSKAAAETWEGDGVAAGVAGYARFYADDEGEGASTTARRLDLSVGTVGTEVIMNSTTTAIGATSTVTAATLSL
jgi:hypothetical protein